MYFLQGVAIGIILVCHIIVWFSTHTWYDFILYSIGMHVIGALLGIPAGLIVGKSIIKTRRERKRVLRVEELTKNKLGG